MNISIPHPTLTFIQNGERITAGVDGVLILNTNPPYISDSGVVNRPLRQLLLNDIYLQDAMNVMQGTMLSIASDFGDMIGGGYTDGEIDTLLSGKSDVGHGHIIADVSGLQTTLDAKSDDGHVHLIADVTGLQDALDSLDDSGTVNWGDIIGKPLIIADSDVTALGSAALVNNMPDAMNGINNSAFGQFAMHNNTLGSKNSAFGSHSLVFNTVGVENSAFGFHSLYSNTGGSYNTAGGVKSLLNTNGRNNTSFGYSSGSTSLTGDNITCLGANAQPSSTSVSNEVTLGNSFVTTLRCAATVITAVSDARDKKDFKPFDSVLPFINDLNPGSFLWNCRDGSRVNIVDSGFIAQELDAALESHNIDFLPGLVHKENPDSLGAAYSKLLPVLVRGIQELSERIIELENLIQINQQENVVEE